MKFFGNVDLQKNLLKNASLGVHTELPSDGALGEIAFVGKAVHICVEITNGVPTWIPLTNTITSFVHDQTTAATTWSITHGLDTESIIVQAYDSLHASVIPTSITAVSVNEVVVTFGTQITGTAVVISGSSGLEGAQGPKGDQGEPGVTQTLASLGIPNVENKSSAMIRSELTSADVVTALTYVPGTTQTLATLGIPNVENKSSATIRSELTSANVTSALTYTPLNAALVGAANGVVPLGSNSLISSTYLPSYVDDVLEFANLAALPPVGETGKIYITQDTNFEYRWSGSAYVRIVASPGTTDEVPEGSTNKYFTALRAIGSALTGYVAASTNSVVLATDTILVAIGKLQKQISDLPSAQLPYDISGSILGKPAASAVVARFVSVRSITIPVTMTGSIAKAALTATASTVLTVAKNGTAVGTITFSAGATSGVFAAASPTTLVAGDILTVTAPASADATFGDCEFTILAALT